MPKNIKSIACILLSSIFPLKTLAADPLQCEISPFGADFFLFDYLEPYTLVSNSSGVLEYTIHDTLNSDRQHSGDVGEIIGSSTHGDYALAAVDITGDNFDDQYIVYLDKSKNEIVSLLIDPTNLRDPLPIQHIFTGKASATNFVAAALEFGNGPNPTKVPIMGYIEDGTSLNLKIVSELGKFASDNQSTGSWSAIIPNLNSDFEEGRVINLSMDTGDINGDGINNEIVVVVRTAIQELKLMAFTFDETFDPNSSGSNGLQRLFTKTVQVPTFPAHFRVRVGDIDAARNPNAGGVLQDEIVLMTDRVSMNGDPQGTVQLRSFRIFSPSELNAGNCRADSSLCLKEAVEVSQVVRNDSRPKSIDMVLVDSDNDFKDEVFLGWGDSDSTNVLLLDAEHVFEPNGLMVERPESQETSNSLGLDHAARSISIAAFKNRGGYGRVYMVYEIGNTGNIDSVVLMEDPEPDELAVDPDSNELKVDTTPRKLVAIAQPDDTIDGDRQLLLRMPFSGRSPKIALGDRYNDPISAKLNLSNCKTVTEANVTEMIFAPPHWSDLNGSASAEIGESVANSVTTGTTAERSYSHSINTFYSAEAGIEGAFAEIHASFKAEVAKEYVNTSSTALFGGDETKIEHAESIPDDFVSFESTSYNCYSYDILSGSKIAQTVGSTLCELREDDIGKEGVTTKAWDGEDTAFPPQDYLTNRYWVPANRSWSNLTLRSVFGGDPVQASQSGINTNSADIAIDSLKNRAEYSMTAPQESPWWQVDLGASREITKLRLWNRTDERNIELDDFYVFVSDQPFTDNDIDTIRNNPDTLIEQRFRNGVENYVAGNPVTTVRTLKQDLEGKYTIPVKARYVRIQLAKTGIERTLSLVEVEVFGPDHIDPIGYPTDIRKSGTNTQTQIFDPRTGTSRWVDIDGELIFDGNNFGASYNVTSNNGEDTWNLSDSTFSGKNITDSREFNTTVGIEVSLTAKAGLVATFSQSVGGGFSESSGITRASSRETQITNSTWLGGSVMSWPDNGFSNCEYKFIPYMYITRNLSDFGFIQEYLVLDYYIPNSDLNRSIEPINCISPDPVIKVTGNNVPILHDDDKPSAFDSTDFGESVIKLNNSRIFTITNDSPNQDAMLILGDVDLNSGRGFTLSRNVDDIELASGESTSFTITFKPNSLTDSEAFVTLPYSYNASSLNKDLDFNFKFKIAGTGILPNTIANFESNELVVSEGVVATTIKVIRTLDISNSATLDYETFSETATAQVDFQYNKGSLEFSPGQREKSFLVFITNDSDIEFVETFEVKLTNPIGTQLGDKSVLQVIIIDNEQPMADVITIDPISSAISEDMGIASIGVTRRGTTNSLSTVDYFTSDGTAISGEDYAPANGTLTFAPGSNFETILINILDDFDFEPGINETFNLSLINPTGAVLGASNLVQIAISDNDLTPPPPEILTINSDGTLTDAFIEGGVSADGGKTYTADLKVGESMVVVVSITPEVEDIGLMAEIFVVVQSESGYVQITPEGTTSYDITIGELMALDEFVLEPTNNVDVLAPFGSVITVTATEVGSYRIYVGYSTGGGVITYTMDGIELNVTL